MRSQKRAAVWCVLCVAGTLGVAGCTTGATDGDIRPTTSRTASQSMSSALPGGSSASGPVDSGPREGARGDAIVSDSVEAYLVADGDELESIAQRYGLELRELTHSEGTPFAAGEALSAGDYVYFVREQADADQNASELADTGARDHATGEALFDDGGAVVKYVVAEGDRGDEIGLRFGTIAKQIYHDDGEFEGRNVLNWGQIYPGDVLRFDP